jgi:hypothetical protein
MMRSGDHAVIATMLTMSMPFRSVRVWCGQETMLTARQCHYAQRVWWGLSSDCYQCSNHLLLTHWPQRMSVASSCVNFTSGSLNIRKSKSLLPSSPPRHRTLPHHPSARSFLEACSGPGLNSSLGLAFARQCKLAKGDKSFQHSL